MDEVEVISEERFLDAGEKDANGFYDYYYSGVTVIVGAGDVRYRVVFYDDEPQVASFKGTTKDGRNTLEVDPNDLAFGATVKLLIVRYHIHSVSLYDPTDGGFQRKDVNSLPE